MLEWIKMMFLAEIHDSGLFGVPDVEYAESIEKSHHLIWRIQHSGLWDGL